MLSDEVGSDFSIASLSNRTVVYKGLAELSQIGRLYPDLRDEHYASRFVLFHSRYSTNTTTAWRRAQPFWALGHNGEISTIKGNVAWMEAIGPDLVSLLVERHPRLAKIGARVRSIICAGGSDTANLDDMVIALLTGGLSLPQAILALLPEAPSLAAASDRLTAFHEAMSVFLGACDGPAAIVACDGDEAVAHLDRNGLRPLWLLTTQRLRARGERAHGHGGPRAGRDAAALRAGRHRGREPQERRRAADGRRAPARLEPALPDAAQPGRGRGRGRAGRAAAASSPTCGGSRSRSA